MSLWSRITNAFRSDRLNNDIDRELNAHIEEAIASGRDPHEVRRSFGSPLRHREASRDAKLLSWLDSLRSDSLFALRQLRKRKITSAATILSLALAIGACLSAFRLIDAMLLRPLPIASADRLYQASRQGLNFNGVFGIYDGGEYPLFQQMQASAKDEADLIAVSFAKRNDLTFSSDDEMEKAYIQYVSGSMFSLFGLQPEVGRLLTENDDQVHGQHPYAVLSKEYWSQRFGQDPNVVGRTFHLGSQVFQIIGVVKGNFTGTEPGTITDIFIPTMMNEGVTHNDWSWIRTFALLKPGIAPEPLQQKFTANFRAFQEGRMKDRVGVPPEKLRNFLSQQIVLQPASSGASSMQRSDRPLLLAVAVLVTLVLLIACANVANLLSAQSAARSREMALRISIGAGRSRLVQLMLVESGWIAIFAVLLGSLFAFWSAPFILGRINPPDDPMRLPLPVDARLFVFAGILAFLVTCLFGVLPALRASSVKPASALKGGENPHHRRHFMNALIAIQVAFCFLVLFVSGLFVATANRLVHQPLGFSEDRLITIDAVTKSPQTSVTWHQVADSLRAQPGIEKVAIADWPLLDGNGWNGFVSINNAPALPILSYFLKVSPNWLDTMKIPLVDGRDFLPSDNLPGAAIVNEAFVQAYFNGQNVVGKFFKMTNDPASFQIVGVVRDARYRDLREPLSPTAYLPFQPVSSTGLPEPMDHGSFIIRTAAANPLSLAATLRQEISRTRSEFRVSLIRTQAEITSSHSVRERLLSMLASFFAVVALLLAAVGLYGVLHYSVLQRRREIAVRIAIGAQSLNIIRLITLESFFMIAAGAAAGLALGMFSTRYIESLLYQVNPTELSMLAIPSAILLAAAIFASVPAILRAIHTDPAEILRAD